MGGLIIRGFLERPSTTQGGITECFTITLTTHTHNTTQYTHTESDEGMGRAVKNSLATLFIRINREIRKEVLSTLVRVKGEKHTSGRQTDVG